MKVLINERLSQHKMKTNEGYLICTDAVLARTGKQQYRKADIWPTIEDGADEIIDIDRFPEDVFKDSTLASFENKPITIEHPDVDVNTENYHEYAVGFVRDVRKGKDNGQDVIIGDLVFTDQRAIDLIESGEMTELSCGYNCDIVGDDNPHQTNITGNHVALCRQGRAGNARIIDTETVNDEANANAVLKEITKIFADNITKLGYTKVVNRNVAGNNALIQTKYVDKETAESFDADFNDFADEISIWYENGKFAVSPGSKNSTDYFKSATELVKSFNFRPTAELQKLQKQLSEVNYHSDKYKSGMPFWPDTIDSIHDDYVSVKAPHAGKIDSIDVNDYIVIDFPFDSIVKDSGNGIAYNATVNGWFDGYSSRNGRLVISKNDISNIKFNCYSDEKDYYGGFTSMAKDIKQLNNNVKKATRKDVAKLYEEDGYEILDSVKDGDIDTSTCKRLAAEIAAKFHVSAVATGYSDIECEEVESGSKLDKQITAFLKSKGYKVGYDGIDDAGCYEISDSVKTNDKLVGNGEVHFIYKGNKIKTNVWNKDNKEPDEIITIANKYGCKVMPMNDRWNDVWLIGNANDEKRLCQAWHEINSNYSVEELMSLRDSIKDKSDDTEIEAYISKLWKILPNAVNIYAVSHTGVSITMTSRESYHAAFKKLMSAGYDVEEWDDDDFELIVWAKGITFDSVDNDAYYTAIEPHSGHSDYLNEADYVKANKIIEDNVRLTHVKAKEDWFKTFYYGKKEDVNKFVRYCKSELDDYYWLIDEPKPLTDAAKKELHIRDSLHDSAASEVVAGIKKYYPQVQIKQRAQQLDNGLFVRLYLKNTPHEKDFDQTKENEFTRLIKYLIQKNCHNKDYTVTNSYVDFMVYDRAKDSIKTNDKPFMTPISVNFHNDWTVDELKHRILKADKQHEDSIVKGYLRQLELDAKTDLKQSDFPADKVKAHYAKYRRMLSDIQDQLIDCQAEVAAAIINLGLLGIHDSVKDAFDIKPGAVFKCKGSYYGRYGEDCWYIKVLEVNDEFVIHQRINRQGNKYVKGNITKVPRHYFKYMLAGNYKQVNSLNDSVEGATLNAIKADVEKAGNAWFKKKLGADAKDYYFNVKVKLNGDDIVCNIGAELDYADMDDLTDALNAALKKYDKDAIFEQEQPGLAAAWIAAKDSVVKDTDTELQLKFENALDNARISYHKLSSTWYTGMESSFKKIEEVAKKVGCHIKYTNDGSGYFKFTDAVVNPIGNVKYDDKVFKKMYNLLRVGETGKDGIKDNILMDLPRYGFKIERHRLSSDGSMIEVWWNYKGRSGYNKISDSSLDRDCKMMAEDLASAIYHVEVAKDSVKDSIVQKMSTGEKFKIVKVPGDGFVYMTSLFDSHNVKVYEEDFKDKFKHN